MRNLVGKRLGLAALFAVAAIMGTANADTMTSLPGATFGGSGIPNDDVVVSTDAAGITLGLAAHSRFSATVLANDGVNTFFADPGIYPATTSTALWNFDFYMDGPTGTTYQLLYDFDPAWSPVPGNMGSIGILGAASEGSENLGFGWLTLEFPPFVDGPSYTPFDPTVDGRYTFTLIAYDGATEVDRATMHVVVGNPPVPEPATMALFGIGLAGMAALRKRHTLRAR